jgi:hypothetical protein
VVELVLDVVDFEIRRSVPPTADTITMITMTIEMATLLVAIRCLFILTEEAINLIKRSERFILI